LPKDVVDDIAVTGHERGPPSRRCQTTDVIDHRRPVRHIESVVENRVAEKNKMTGHNGSLSGAETLL
jgi:hypothetical protein